MNSTNVNLFGKSAASFWMVLAAVCSAPESKAQAQQGLVGSISAISGAAKIIRASGEEPATKGASLSETDKIETGAQGVIQVKFSDGSSFTLYEKSSVRIDQYKKKSASNSKGIAQSVFDVAQGKLKFFVNPKAKEKGVTQFKSKTAIMGIRGTSGIIDVAPNGGTQLVVLTGLVEVKNPKFPDVAVNVAPNFSTKVDANVAPQAPKPVSKEVIQSLVPVVSKEAGFTEDGPVAVAPQRPKENQDMKGQESQGKGEKSEPSKLEGEKIEPSKPEGDKSEPNKSEGEKSGVKNQEGQKKETLKNQPPSKSDENKPVEALNTPKSENESGKAGNTGAKPVTPAKAESLKPLEANQNAESAGFKSGEVNPSAAGTDGPRRREMNQGQGNRESVKGETMYPVPESSSVGAKPNPGMGVPQQPNKFQNTNSQTFGKSPSNGGDIRPSMVLFAPGGEVVNKAPDTSELQSVQSNSRGPVQSPGQNNSRNLNTKSPINSASKENFSAFNPSQMTAPLLNQTRDFERASAAVNNVIEKTTESVKQNVQQTTQILRQSQQPTKVKVKVGLPND